MEQRTALLALVVALCLFARAHSAPAWPAAGLMNVAEARTFVSGPTYAEWYHQDEPDTESFIVSRYCGYIGYAHIAHLSCDPTAKDTQRDAPFVSGLRDEVASCVFGSTIDYYEIVPGVGADAFTATCQMRNGDTCGASHCQNVELHISGTAFLVRNSYALTNPDEEGLEDPNCQDVEDRRVPGSKREKKGHHKGRGPKSPLPAHNNTQAAAMATNYGRDQHNTGPTTLPAKVWAGYTYVYSGYMEVIDKKHRRKAGDGYFEMVWPTSRFVDDWREVDSATLPADALFVRRPYKVTMQFWDDKSEGPDGSDRKYYRD